MNTTDDLGLQSLQRALDSCLTGLKIGMIIVGVYFIFSGIFIVHQDENALVLRFGKVTGTLADRIKKPGIHWAFPYPIDEVVRIPVTHVELLESDSFWYAISQVEQQTKEQQIGNALIPGVDGYLLTGDANIIHTRLALRYTIIDPVSYLFSYHDTRRLIQALLDHSVICIAAGLTIDDALRRDIEGFRQAVLKHLSEQPAVSTIGIQIQGLDVIALSPPRQVKRAFDAVIEAEQERSRSINQAQAYALRSKEEARGESARIVSAARTFQSQIVHNAKADATYFENVYEQYTQSPDVISRILYDDRIARIITQCKEKYIFTTGADATHKKRQLRVQLNTAPSVPQTNNPEKG